MCSSFQFFDFCFFFLGSVGRNSAKVHPRGSEKTFEQVPIILGEQEEEKIVKPSVWKVTCPDGSRWTKSNGIKEELPPALICVATDPDTKQVLLVTF